MKKKKFSELLKGQEELEKKILLAFSELLADHMTKNHIQKEYVINHVIEDYDLQYYVTTKDHVKDHPER